MRVPMPTRTLASIAMLLAVWAPAALAETAVNGHWEGKIALPGQGLAINVDFETAEDGTLTGDISIPVQGLRDLDLVDVALDGNKIRFRIPDIPGNPTFDGTVSADGERIEGNFEQGESKLTFELNRGLDPAEAARAALAGVDEMIDRALSDFNVPGFAIAVVAGDEIVYAKGFGHRDLENGLPMTADSLFAIGSTTKAMTATLLGMLVDEGRLEWDEPLRTHLPRFRLNDPMITERITPRDIVTHRSGLPRHDLLWYNDNDSTRAEVVARLAHLELTEDLRAKFQYNNLMFMTAGYLVGQLTDSTWEEQMRRRLFDPLGMTRSNFHVDESQRDPDHAKPYRENDDDEIEPIPFRPIQMMGPAGSVNSSVNEMAQWLRFNLRRGKIGDEQVINPSTLTEIQSSQMTTGATPDRVDVSPATYGMGWVLDTYRGHRRVSHGGGIDGFATSVMLFPDDDLGLVSFNNRGAPLPGLINRTVADRVLGLDPGKWLGEALEERHKGKDAQKEAEKKKETTRVQETRPSHPLNDYAGEYEHQGYGALRVTTNASTLGLSYNGMTVPLEHWHYDVWNGAQFEDEKTFEDMKFQFRSNVDGLIASVESRFEPTANPIVFSKKPDAKMSDPDYLIGLTGTYETATGTKVTIELSGTTLTVTVPGQPVYTLEPDLSGRFLLAEVPLISVGFEVEGGKARQVLLYQPSGVFEAKRVEQ